MPSQLTELKKALKKNADPKKAAFYPRFFKTGPGEYGEGDQFIGVTVPHQRQVAKNFRDLSATDLTKLLASPIHEHRLTALLIMVDQFKRGDAKQQTAVTKLYEKNLRHVNNWDLVDSSAPYILGPYLLDKSRSRLYKLAKSPNLWRQRIAIMSTFAFIKADDFTDTLKLAKIFLHHDHDLMHKAVGWMLREVGNHDRRAEEAFLKQHYQKMPRTMLRYAIEKFPEKKRQQYLKGKI